MSAADGPAWNREAGSASLPTLTISDGWQSSNAPVPKTERASRLRGCNSYTIRQFLTLNERKYMKPVIRYQSQLLIRRSYKPNRLLRFRLMRKLNVTFVPENRFGAKPKIVVVP